MLKTKHMFFVIDVHIHKYVVYDLQIEKCIVPLANLSNYEQYTYEIWLRILKVPRSLILFISTWESKV